MLASLFTFQRIYIIAIKSIGPLPMQLAVGSAVMTAVRATTMAFTTVSRIFFLFIVFDCKV